VKSLELDLSRRLLSKDGHQIRRLTPQEAHTLDFLIRRVPSVVTNEELQNALWPGTEVSDPPQRIREIVADLRTILGDSAKVPCFIETTSGVGYSFVGTIEPVEEEPSPVQPAPPADMAQPVTTALPRQSEGPWGWKWVLIFLFLVVLGSSVSVLIVSAHRPSATSGATNLPRVGRIFARSTSEGKTPPRLDLGYKVGALVLSPDGKTIYAFELLGRTVTVVGTADLEIQRKFKLPYDSRGHGVGISRDGRRLYVASQNDAVMVVGTERGDLERLIPAGGPVWDLAITHDERKLFLAMGNAGLKRIEIQGQQTATLSSFACPVFLETDGPGKRLFVSYQCGGPGGRTGHDSLEIYDTASELRTAVIQGLPMVGGPPVVSPDGEFVLLNASDACVTADYDHVGCPQTPSAVFDLIRIADRSVVKSFARPQGTFGAAFSPDGTRLLFCGDSLVVMDWAKQTITEVAPGQRGTHMVFTPDGGRLFLAGDGENELAVFDTEGPGCGSRPSGVANQYSGDGTFDDSVGVSRLEAIGTIGFAPGVVGQAFKFRGAGDSLRGDPASACWPCDGDWTESFFAKFESTDGEMTLLERDAPSPYWYHRILKSKDDHILLKVGDPLAPLSISSPASLQVNRWYHVALVASGVRRRFYVDGVEMGWLVLPDYPGADPHGGPALLGAGRGKLAPFRGLLDEITWHRRALSGEEVMALAKARATCAEHLPQ